MRGQATIEFLSAFLVTIAFIAVVAIAILSSSNKSDEQAESIAMIIALEEATRAIEVHANSGIAMVFDVKGVSSGVENGKVHVDYEGKVIEAEGVFDGYEIKAQPV